MADLSQFRGKRALVYGVPDAKYKTHGMWKDAVSAALRSIGVTGASFFEGTGSQKAIRTALRSDDVGVLIACLNSSQVGGAQRAAKAAGVPVLRVRRDGSVEVDDA